jgi:ubiquinone/menaquinone biosynthesis C-methylase UbiE
MTHFTPARTAEDVKPVPVRMRAGFAGFVQFAVRKIVDLQLHTIWQFLGPILPTLRGSLLDVGCGEMPFRFALHADVRYTGIDVEEALAFGMMGDEAICAFDGRTIPFPDDHFDNILCTEVLEHAEQPERLMAEMHRVLKPGGFLLLTVPFAARVHHAPYDFHRFTRYKLAQLFDGFSEKQIAPRGNDIATIANKLIVLTMRLLSPSPHMAWSLPMAILTAPVAGVFLIAAHLAIAANMGSSDDPLGYSVMARK